MISKPKLSRGQLLAVVAMVVILGAAIIFFVRAATLKNAEPETWTASGGTVAVKADATAADGNYVEFLAPAVSTTPTTSPGDPTPTDTAPAADVSWKPDADNPNTGVLDYTKLKPCAGGDITQSGTATSPYIIENCDFTGQVTVRGDYVTIRNSRFSNGYPFNLLVTDIGDRADNFTGENIDFNGGGEACFVTWAVKTTLRKSDIKKCVDGVKYNGGRFEYNWIHDMTLVAPECPYPQCDGSHTDGMQITGGMVDDAAIIGNNIQLGAKLPTWGPDKSFQMGGETQFEPNPCMANLEIKNNWIDGRNTYWSSFFKESTNTVVRCKTTDKLSFVGNRFYRQSDSGGVTGYYDVQRNNVWHDAGQTTFNGQLLNVSANQAVSF